jgi:hypothetical protein
MWKQRKEPPKEPPKPEVPTENEVRRPTIREAREIRRKAQEKEVEGGKS